MEIISSPMEMQNTIKDLKSDGSVIGFVPTMGFLHEGHASLIQKARETADIVVLSIFVNPTQFGPNEDYDSYPRNFEKDVQLAKQLNVDMIFHPKSEEMYPLGEGMSITVNERVQVLCGKSRPGHFAGVATVLAKLFNIICPDKIYFGLKDAQQVAIVDGLIKHFHFPIELVPCDTVREEDGLAKSSRNVRLSDDERREAPGIYRGLQEGLVAVKAGQTDPNKIEKHVLDSLKEDIKLGSIDYVDVLDYPDLNKSKTLSGRFIIACAVKYQDARLIDNIVANLNEPHTGD
ncbi:pantothenate synthetase [Scopulibacillus darangshiensis]|uniref:Pantothenate synthetase n=1 Tax=Scopulibacillus darangshiensis TaxID=442528 RepID=A0A4R2P9C1_9BACL|nr:pantoate--beta-alanine ligase [Scopulibacillus darangshiensis]TCP31613.1 pantothenate synthetase [Scopulibacillus darangshiensis]